MSSTSPCTQPPVCQPMTLSLGALVSHGGVVIGGRLAGAFATVERVEIYTWHAGQLRRRVGG